MKWFTVLIFLSHQLLAYGVPVTESTLSTPRPSMLNMLAKFIELNKTIDTVIEQSPEHSRNRIWLNATRSPQHANSVCKKDVELTETIEVVDKIPYEGDLIKFYVNPPIFISIQIQLKSKSGVGQPLSNAWKLKLIIVK
jgi:hypothetical protein